MMASFVHKIVIALAFLQASSGAAPRLNPIADRATYAVFAAVLQPMLAGAQPTRPIVLQRETERPPTAPACTSLLAHMTGEWADAAASFQRENARVRLIEPGVLGEYRLVSRSEILAEDARLAAEHPGQTTNALRAGAIEYLAFAAVGFNATKTKALVYVRSRTSGGIADGIGMWELTEGRWSWVKGSPTCGGIA